MASNDNLVTEIAELLYMADSQALPWNKALDEDTKMYTDLAIIVVDAVTGHLRKLGDMSDGATVAAVSLLDAQVDIARLRK